MPTKLDVSGAVFHDVIVPDGAGPIRTTISDKGGIKGRPSRNVVCKKANPMGKRASTWSDAEQRDPGKIDKTKTPEIAASGVNRGIVF